MACNNLGFLIEKKQPHLAERLYAQACAHDIPPACHNLGFVVHRQGDLARAVPLFVKACGLSHEPACETLGTMMMVQAKRTGRRACLEIPQKNGRVGQVCADPEKSGGGDDERMKENRKAR